MADGQPLSRWGGFRLIQNVADNSAELVADDDEVLNKTVGNLHGTGYFERALAGASERQLSGDWVVTEVLARGTNLEVEPHILRRGELNFFVYKVPYMSNMDYPPELYENLAHFAKEHYRDKFNGTAMLFAVQLWVDIVDRPDRMVEPFSAHNPEAPELPHVSLAVFLVYFETWLKFHEHLRCIQYIHPFRVMNTMFLRDIATDSDAFTTRMHILDEEAIRVLVLQGVSRRAEFPVTTRVEYFPFLMNGTSMAAPQDFQAYQPFSPTEQVLIGMPSISILGLPSLHRQEGHARLVAMPASIARLSFHGLTMPVMERYPANFQDVDVIGMTSQFGQLSTSGTIWAHDFMPDGDVTTIRERMWATDPAMNPGLPLSYFVNPNMEITMMRKQRRRLAWVKHLGVTDIRQLTVGPDGLYGFPGMPLESEDFPWPSALQNLMAIALKDPYNRAALPEALVLPETLLGIISTIAGRPNLAHVAWSRAAPQLQEMATNLENTRPTVRKVLEVLKSAKSSYWSDWRSLNDLVQQAETDIGVLVGRDSSPISWIGQAMVRMVGEHADPEPSRNWWPNHEETGNRIAENSPDAFASIDLVIDQLIRVERLRDSGNVEEAKQVAHNVLLMLKTFAGLHANGPVIVSIEEHIRDIKDYARSKGYEV